ncbi:hypothetical protein BH11BAC3_BH11BAC3_32380 [soil metagenome]
MLLLITCSTSIAQSVGIGTTIPDASSVLELKATNKGFLPPRMTAAEKGLIVAPKAGLMIYQTDAPAGLYIYNGTAWAAAAGTASVSGWALNGNSSTTASSFIGTRDNQPLKFRVNDIPSGELNHITSNVAYGPYTLQGGSSGKENTAIGTSSLNNNSTGGSNTGIGSGSLLSNTIGNNNTALGINTMVFNVNGNNNLAAGSESLFNNLTGSSNVALGSRAAYNSTDAGYVIAIGDSALYYNVVSYSVGMGAKALFANTTGISNTALGSQTLTNNTIGFQNTAVGRIALYSNVSGNQNTAIGTNAAKLNQTGSGNTAVGVGSLFWNVASSNNTGVGISTLANNIANDNTAIGKAALMDNTTGFSNTALGLEALGTNTIGNYNTAIGYRANTWGTNFTNATAIGANAQAGCSNCVVLGSVNGYNGATVTSKVGIGTTSPQKALHVNPGGAGGMMIGNDITTGGYTVLNMGISQASGGYSYIQSVKTAWPTPTYGDLVLNPSGGNVAIGKTSASTPLHIKQTTDNFPYNGSFRLERHDNGNYWDISVSFADVLHFVYKGVEKVRFSNIDGDIWQSSDLRLKKDVQNFETALPRLMKLEAKSYHYKDNADGAPLSYGFIAQEVEKIFPGAVASLGKDGMKSIAYQKLNILAIKSIQEQQVIIEAQQKQIDINTQQNILMMDRIKKLEMLIEEIQDAKK